MIDTLSVSQFVQAWHRSALAEHDNAPWNIVQNASRLIRSVIPHLGAEYETVGEMAVHKSALVEDGSILKGPGIIGPRCFIAAGAYLRDGAYLDENCTIGPGCELKTSFMFAGSKIAHLNFVGDSILGSHVNVEAGAIVANYRNEFVDKQIRILHHGISIATGVEKFGALIGDRARIGANAVLAPGTIIPPDTVIGRLQLIDQHAA